MEKTEQFICKRSPAAVFFKKILVVSKSLLPANWYNIFYKLSFSSYKAMVRAAYFRFPAYYKIKGDKEKFNEAKTVFRVMPYSLVGAGGLSQTYNIVSWIKKKNIRGNLVECGVAQGGCAGLMALKVFEDGDDSRKLWLFDSYEGLPEAGADDILEGTKSAGDFIRPLEKGSCLGTYAEVEKLLFSKLKIKRNNVRMVKGWFQDTLPEYKNKIGKISLLRIDADWYDSTKCCLENLYDNVVAGGFIVIDDYGTCFGAKKALDEFLKSKNFSPNLVHDGRGGCYFKKNY